MSDVPAAMTGSPPDRSAPGGEGLGARLRARRPSAELAVALVFVLAAGGLGLADVFVDDEGHLSYIGAALLRRLPVDTLFFQKIHPAASALYAPFVGWGWHAYVAWHVVLAAAAVFLLGATARRLGGSGWLAALVVAASPLYFMAAAAGISNTTGIFFLALAFFLYLGDTPRSALAAGIVAAAGLWSRYEQVPYLLGLLAYASLVRRDRSFVLAFAGTIALYVGLGALYHGSILWPLERPPVLLKELGPSTLGAMGFGPDNVRELLVRLLLVTPLYLAPALLPPWRAVPASLRWLSLVLLAAALAQFVLPLLGGWFNYDHTARYFLAHLPALALLSSFAVKQLPAPGRRVTTGAVVVAGAVAVAYAGFGVGALLGSIAFVVPILLVARRARPALGAAAIVLALQVVPGTLYARSQTASVPDPRLTALVERVRQEPAHVAVYTNAHQVDRLLDVAGAGNAVRFLPGYDIVLELGALLADEQADRVFEALRPLLYGDALWPCEFPRRLEAGSLLLLRAEDDRAGRVYDFASWTSGAQLVSRLDGLELWRVGDAVVVPPAPLPSWMSRKEFCLPCQRTCSAP